MTHPLNPRASESGLRTVAGLRKELREQSKRHNKLMASACREIAGLKIKLQIAQLEVARRCQSPKP